MSESRGRTSRRAAGSPRPGASAPGPLNFLRSSVSRLRHTARGINWHQILFYAWLSVGSFLNWALGWQDLLPWTAFMSLYAIVATHGAGANAWKAKRMAKEAADS